MAYKDKKIEQMHQNKMQRYDNRDLGMQIGACLNKAVDLVIAEYSKTETSPDVDEFIKHIKDWTDILFKIGTDKKIKETTPQPVDIGKAVKMGEKFKKNVLEAEKQKEQAQLDEINQEVQEEKSLEKELPIINIDK